MPDADIFPGPVARISRALMTYISDANLARGVPAGAGGPSAGGRSAAVGAGDGAAAGGGAADVAVTGVGASPGVYEGRACVLSGPESFSRLESGDVLVAILTSPAYNTVLPLVGAVVTDKGGALCHAAIVAREFGIPAVVGTRTGTHDIPDGAKVRVDGTRGTVTLLG
jgi:pyruvate,water dikinase